MERTHTREADRGNAAELERFLMDTLKKAGPECIHTVRSLATAIFGDDGLLEERHLRAARRLVTRLQKRGVPLVPCDEEGKLLSDDEANSRAKHGRQRMWRCYADGRLARELMDDAESRDSFADGLLALEASDSPAVFFEPRERLLRGLRSLVSKDEYDQAKRRFTAALEKASQHPEVLTGHVSQSKMHEQPAPWQATGFTYLVRLMSRCPLPFPPVGSEPPQQRLQAS